MIDYRFNDGGRADSGRKGEARDCVVRAICILTGRDYSEVYRAVAAAQAETTGRRSAREGVRTRSKAFADYLSAIGVVKVKLPRGPLPTYTEAHDQYGACIVSTTKHWACLKDGALQDTHDDRVYEWENDWGEVEERERKARSVWVLEG